tara:strand:- start:343 stop:486 length:144 start_codon:yes stop_codon:yes gene_type:complete
METICRVSNEKLPNKDLMQNIIEIKEADIIDGGSGAFYIYLKKNKVK